MIKVTDFPAVRDQIERAEAVANEKPTPAGDANPAATERPPLRNMVLAGGKYYVTEADK